MAMPSKYENRESMQKGEARLGRDKKTVAADYQVGSSNCNGIRFKLPDYPDKSNVRSPEKG